MADMIPEVSCKIEAACEVNPSEDPKKLEQALGNILDNAEFHSYDGSLMAISNEIESLSKIHESIQNHNTQKTYWRLLNNNLDGNSAWFYLNKQAAFVNNVAICEHDDESPLGPIKITIQSKSIERIIEWLTSN